MTEGGIEAASATYTLPGQDECGDRQLVMRTAHGAIFAVIDGIGHGGEAAKAAERAVTCIRQMGRTETLTDTLRRCHTALADSRGAVMDLAAFDNHENTLTWLGIGNVEGRLLLRGNQKGYVWQNLLLRPGVVGQRLPSLQAAVTRVQHGDMVIFATDGVTPDFAEQIRIDGPVNEIADDIIRRYCKRTDDALALVVRYLG